MFSVWLPWGNTNMSIGGDTLSAGAAIAAPLRILGQQPIQNAAPTQTMFHYCYLPVLW